MAKRLSKPKTFNEENIGKIPNQSGAYVLWRKGGRKPYIEKAEAGNLRKRVRQHFVKKDKRYVNKFSISLTGGTEEAGRAEKKLRDRFNPEQKI